VHSKGQQEKDSRATAAAMENEQRAAAAAHDKAAREEAKRVAYEAFEGLDEDLRRMNALRVNLESCRMLLDLCKRREKLKKQFIVASAAAHAERLQDPVAALEFLEKLKGLDEMGLTPAEQLEVIFNTSQTGPGGAAHQPNTGVGLAAGFGGRQSRSTTMATRHHAVPSAVPSGKRQRASDSPAPSATPSATTSAKANEIILNDRAKRARRTGDVVPSLGSVRERAGRGSSRPYSAPPPV